MSLQAVNEQNVLWICSSKAPLSTKISATQHRDSFRILYLTLCQKEKKFRTEYGGIKAKHSNKKVHNLIGTKSRVQQRKQSLLISTKYHIKEAKLF
jgi:paraquat-inducible protein B